MALLFIVLFVPVGPSIHAQDSAGAVTFKTGVLDVKVDAQVVMGKDVIKDLNKEDFIVKDQDQPQTITYFGRDSEPLSLVLLLDISGSMQKYIERISATAKEALSYLRPHDRVAILVFAREMAVHQDFSDNFADTSRQIATAATAHDVGTGTYINQAVAEAAEYIHERAGPAGRRAILILTDNLSLAHQFSDDKVLKSLYRSDTVLNAIVVGRAIRPAPHTPGRYFDPESAPVDVFKLAEETGGEAIHADEPEITFREIIERIRTRYLLTYHAPGGRSGSFRRIDVHLTGDGYRRYPWADVHARRGYYVE
ncbi:MAG: VWA domain-containing protein [Acidobacteriaceae bacterium]|nr:VWA domain-containing protein [Acidobacteriaceae bacterium]